MDKPEEIRKRIFQMASTVGPSSTLLAKVKSVDEDEFTCTLEDDDTAIEYFNVRLRPVLDGKESITIFPKVGTWALAVRIENESDFQVIAVGEADKWRLSIGTAIIEQNATGLLIKKQTDSLKDALVLIIEAVTPIVVLQGTNPNYVKLGQALTKIQNILR